MRRTVSCQLDGVRLACGESIDGVRDPRDVSSVPFAWEVAAVREEGIGHAVVEGGVVVL